MGKTKSSPRGAEPKGNSAGVLGLVVPADVAPEAGPQLRTHPLAAGPSSQQLRERALGGRTIDVDDVRPSASRVCVLEQVVRGRRAAARRSCSSRTAESMRRRLPASWNWRAR